MVEPLGEIFWGFLKKLNTEVPYDAAFLLLGSWVRDAVQMGLAWVLPSGDLGQVT